MKEENKNPYQGLEDKVLQAIKDGKVRMRPKWHFVLQGVLVAVGGFMLAATLLYLVSFIIFILQRTGVWFVPSFGFGGWSEFLFSLPWVLILLTLIFLIVLEVLVRRYAFAYRRPLLYSTAGLVVFVMFGGIIVAITPLHRQLFDFAERDELPVAGRIYRSFGHQRFPHIHRGVITAIKNDGFQMEGLRDEVLYIVITPQTRLPYGEDFSIGDLVVVLGPPDPYNFERIMAVGIEEIQPD